ncbi:MAG: tRNA pseudouridine(55) synthase TruB [Planktomarina sp.]|nr:tRNA pseudouridine(55) synthase TruB [Planktomarina sp.]MDV3049419.1 tRNA pseudouridine(55) synthase TruB [Planktomarina sp.]|tara:strand:+ start:99 stop:1001 length:903 start_codon:yes stop_codon:yes gene_type:complete
MGRVRKGRNISGWLLIDKPSGMTSSTVVNKVRWAFDAKKAGHAGTLDPDATGLLAIALGEATKTIPYVTNANKSYSFCIKMGAATNTDDADGEVIATSTKRPTDTEIIEKLKTFQGETMQVPPKFSAVKIDGERAYKLARAGEEVKVSARPLLVSKLILIERPSVDTAILEMTCGKGGYVRAIARDLGDALGCYAHVLNLRRVWAGPFNLKSCITLKTIESFAKTLEIDQFLLPLEEGLTDLPKGTTNAEGAAKLRNGNSAVCFANADYGDEIWASYDGKAQAIGHFKSGEIHPKRVIIQ